MAFDDTFRESISIDPDETYKICRIRKRAEVFDLVGFGDPMTDWSKRASKVGETIIPRQVYLAKMYEQYDHRVAWVYHSQVREDSIEDYHHIACDCVATMENPNEEIDEIVNCPAVLAALEHRAGRVAGVLRTQGVLDFYGKSAGNLEPKPYTMKTVKALVNFLLNYEQKHPEGWVANTVSGEHQIPLLATIMQIRPYPDPEAPDKISMSSTVQEMDADGSLILHDDGLTVSLPKAA